LKKERNQYAIERRMPPYRGIRHKRIMVPTEQIDRTKFTVGIPNVAGVEQERIIKSKLRRIRA
jgi:hypothetical protein